jgi:5,5'-dehydrodivanillate O-demethylase
VLSEEKNKRLTQVGRGTPMGELLRRYWYPIAAVAELEDNPIKPVRLMGEDLVLYRDLSGNHGLVERRCPHRGADLSYGYVEACGLRCSYHGWVFGPDGRCLEQPFEETAHPDSRFKEKVRTTVYPVEAKAGLLWAYLGPEPAPLLPTWEPFTWPNGFVQIVYADIPCNWLQCQENSIDPIHFEWAHSNWRLRLAGETGPYTPRHTKIDFDEFEFGFTYRRQREDTDEESPYWTVGRVCLWPNALFTGSHFEWRVPVDDENTLSVMWNFSRVPKEREPYVQNRIPYWHGPIRDPRTGRWITSHIMNQDFVAWVGQGTVSDRTREHLGISDRGVIMVRNRFLSDIEVVAKGGDPKGVLRDPARNACVPLPIMYKDQYRSGLTRDEIARFPDQAANPFAIRPYPFQAGQPEEVRRAYEDAMGVRLPDSGASG